MKPTGMSILFIPGNAGSFKQVRSIASSAAHQFYERAAQHGSEDVVNSADWKELDFFASKFVAIVGWPFSSTDTHLYLAADFNEEFSAFHSATLEDQSLYVSCAIQYILDLYPTDSPASQSIILVGHSMGGIVARHAVTRLTDSRVSAIITMSTPHLIPPVTFERGMQHVYDKIEEFWRSAWHDSQLVNPSENGHEPPILVSICGGTADTQISSDGCALQPLKIEEGTMPTIQVNSNDKGTFAVFTTGMEGIWTGVDHQAMVWCDQVRRTVATALLDMSAVSQHQSHNAVGFSRQEMTEIARQRFLGERDAQQLQQKGVHVPLLDLKDAVAVTPDSATFRHGGPDDIVLVAKVPNDATRLQIIGDMRVNGVGRLGGSDMSIILETSDVPRSGQRAYRQLPLTDIRLLPKSAASLGSSQREVFPLSGEGVKDEDHMLYVEAELETKLDGERRIAVKLSGAAWGAIAFVAPDSELRT